MNQESRITKSSDGTLIVPDRPVIPFIQGDGIGPDIWHATRMVLDAAVTQAYDGARVIAWQEVLAGEKAQQETGEWLPEETLSTIKRYMVAIKGPLTTPVGKGIRSLNVAIRKQLDLYACVRPVKYIASVPSPMKHPENIDMVVFRENTEDLYVGIEWESGSREAEAVKAFLEEKMGVRLPDKPGIGIKPISEKNTKRLVARAIAHAVKHRLPSVTLMHKGNIMKYTEGAFMKWGYALAEREFGKEVFTWNQHKKITEEKGEAAADEAQRNAVLAGKVIIKDVIADAFLQQILTRPAEYSVIATLNLNGDYISDALAAIVGGIGIAPGANINYETGHAIFEATHGTAPKYADQDKVNPGSVVLSGALMFEYMGWDEAAQKIYESLEKTIQSKKVTYDFHRLTENATLLKTSEFADEIISNIKN